MSEHFKSIMRGLEEAVAYERSLHDLAAERIRKGDVNPRRQAVSLKDAMGEKGYAEYEKINPNEIPDGELFEEEG